jgi:hypothetical protein
MALFGPRTVKCPAGQWTFLFDHAFVQLPQSWTVTFEAADGAVVSGEVEEKKSSWIFPNAPVPRALAPQLVFQRGWWNTFYSVRVKPTQDLTATIR